MLINKENFPKVPQVDLLSPTGEKWELGEGGVIWLFKEKPDRSCRVSNSKASPNELVSLLHIYFLRVHNSGFTLTTVILATMLFHIIFSMYFICDECLVVCIHEPATQDQKRGLDFLELEL